MGTTRSNPVIMPNSQQREHPSREFAMNSQMRPDNAMPIFHGTTGAHRLIPGSQKARGDCSPSGANTLQQVLAGWTKYGPTPGFPEFREAIAAYVSRTRGIHAGPDNVCVVPGGKPIMFFSMVALLEAGDEVIYPNPSFPIYESMIRFLGAKPVPVPLVESRGFSFDLDTLGDRLSSRTKMVILNSPANPTGGVISRDDLERIAGLLRDHPWK